MGSRKRKSNKRNSSLAKRERAKKALRNSVLSLGPEAERQGLTEERLMDELESVKKDIYRKTYGK